MKKITFIGVTVAMAMGFTSCQKESISMERTAGKLITETFSASMVRSDTKTAISDDGATVTWTANDVLYYYTADEDTVRSFTITSTGSSAFLVLERGEGDTYFNLVHAGGTAPTFTVKTSSSMVFDGVKSAQDGTFANANVSVARTVPNGGSITFKPVTALVKFSTSRTDIKTVVLTGGAGTETVAGDISVVPTAASPVATLSGTGSTSSTVTIGTPAAGTYYINILPGTYSSGLKLQLKNAGGNAIGTVFASKSIDLSAGGSMINLGNIDSHINELSHPVPANCYIVSEAGTYKFKTVKGNSTTSVGAVASVAVLWESFGTSRAPSVGDLVTSVSYDDNYIIFSTGGQFPTKKGNAVIAAKDANDNILWSWHIWLTAAPSVHVYRNGAGSVMDRNLGATLASQEVGALGLLYQWGRKDPFLGSSSKSGGNRAASTLTWPAAVMVQDNSNDTELNLRTSIQNPTTFIRNNGVVPNDWYCTDTTYKNDNLWKNVKTIYDPCPPGYRVPDDAIWVDAGFDSRMNAGSYGCYFSVLDPSGDVWYPAAGSISNGSLAFVGGRGGYWSCTVDGGYYSNLLNFIMYASPILPYALNRSYGQSVRCAVE